MLSSIDELPVGARFALAIGIFDGVHRGHQRILETLVEVARAERADPVVLTFDPHPASVLRDSGPALLCDVRERIARIAQAGVATAIVQRFDRRFANQGPAEFLGRLCADRTLVALVMTDESAFGRDRAAGLPEVRRLSQEMGFEAIEVPRLGASRTSVSSSRIREQVESGRLAAAARLLGHRHAVAGVVVAGDRRGRKLGYPTANLAFDEPVVLPPNGIYAVRAGWGGADPLHPDRRADGVASLGVRPTFGGGARILEVYLFDIDEDLYGERLRVEFVRRLRGERRFPSAEALVAQMDRDAKRAREILAA
jgi:riboflavin kinase/FMN adenylyltransferase